MFKNKNAVKGGCTIITFLIALLILVFMSAPATEITKYSLSGLDLIKGYIVSGVRISNFSFLNLIPYILLAILLVFEYLKYALNIFDNRVTRICMTVGFVIVGIMLLFSRYMMNMVNTGAVSKASRAICWGTIIQVIVAFICATLSCIDAILEFEDSESNDNSEETEKNSTDIDELKNEYIEELRKFHKTDEEE